MRRFLRLFTLWLFALALPFQGVLAATAMAGQASPAPHVMTMADGHTMDAADMSAPCPGDALAKVGCGHCCGPVALQQALLAVTPVAVRWAALPRSTALASTPLFLTGGTDRPPRLVLA